MRIRILIAVGVLALLNGFVGWSIIDRWPFAQRHALAAWVVTFGIWLVQLAGPFGDRVWFPKLKARLGTTGAVARFMIAIDWISYLTFGILSCLFVYCVVMDVAETVWRLIDPSSNPVTLDRQFLLALGVGTFITLALGVWQAVRGPVIRVVDIPLANLPGSFDGFTIAQISDLHTSETIRRGYTERVVRMVNNQHPDLVALTGDFADGFVEDLRDHVAPLAHIHAPHGMFFITGNHEYYWDPEGWMREFSKLGARVLRNEHVVIHHNGASLILAGVTDYSTRHMPSAQASNPKHALAGAPSGLPKILLAHQPDSYQIASDAGFDLQISGHTHGGQYFPFNLLIRFFQRYYKGLNRHKNMWVFVSRGTGYWGPPLRTGVSPEIILLRLRHATHP